MELGLVYSPVMAIPPRETAFVLTGYCTDKCTQLVSGAGPGTSPSLALVPPAGVLRAVPTRSTARAGQRLLAPP